MELAAKRSRKETSEVVVEVVDVSDDNMDIPASDEEKDSPPAGDEAQAGPPSDDNSIDELLEGLDDEFDEDMVVDDSKPDEFASKPDESLSKTTDI